MARVMTYTLAVAEPRRPSSRGAAGNGTLEISAGGRAEIQDAVVLGKDVGSLGTLVVDGIDSYLSSGGFNSNQASGQLHSMVIGLQGVGTMAVTNGATVQSTAPQSFAAANADIAATIGERAVCVRHYPDRSRWKRNRDNRWRLYEMGSRR